MTTQAITLQLPSSLYELIRSRAEQTRHTVEAEVLNLVKTAVNEDRLPDDVAAAVEGLGFLDDAALWRAARSTLTAEQQQQLEALIFKQQREGLTREEHATHATLLHAYDRAVLVRARAAELLADRGHNVAELLGSR